VKKATRGREVTIEDFQAMYEELDVSEDVRAELQALTPADYTGIADELADDV
jgi:adenylosuccinate lyase